MEEASENADCLPDESATLLLPPTLTLAPGMLGCIIGACALGIAMGNGVERTIMLSATLEDAYCVTPNARASGPVATVAPCDADAWYGIPATCIAVA